MMIRALRILLQQHVQTSGASNKIIRFSLVLRELLNEGLRADMVPRRVSRGRSVIAGSPSLTRRGTMWCCTPSFSVDNALAPKRFLIRDRKGRTR
jgi:hypothetical protein